MLTVVSEVSLKRATSPERGNVQLFLERLLVEVASENYRYFLSEHLSFRRLREPETHVFCWPPLLANERQVSGLFAVGLSRVCPVSRPEHPITRAQSRREGQDDLPQSRSGRIDFIATYGQRQIALELKRCPIATIGNPSTKAGLSSQWATVSSQAAQALSYMRSERTVYDFPVSVGLLVIRVSRKVTSKREVEAVREAEAKLLPSIATSVKKLTSADFLAYHTLPTEMQVSYGWGVNEDQYRVFPGVVFAAVVQGNARRQAKVTDA
jgi:hypothetical protein